MEVTGRFGTTRRTDAENSKPAANSRQFYFFDCQIDTGNVNFFFSGKLCKLSLTLPDGI
jgi:hypothetical protein